MNRTHIVFWSVTIIGSTFYLFTKSSHELVFQSPIIEDKSKVVAIAHQLESDLFKPSHVIGLSYTIDHNGEYVTIYLNHDGKEYLKKKSQEYLNQEISFKYSGNIISNAIVGGPIESSSLEISGPIPEDLIESIKSLHITNKI